MGNKHKKHSADKERTDVLKSRKKNNNNIEKKGKKKKKKKKQKQEANQKKIKKQEERAQKEKKKESEQKKKNDEKKEETKAKLKNAIRKVWKESKRYRIAIYVLTPIAAYIFEKMGHELLIGITSVIGPIVVCVCKHVVSIARELKDNGIYDEKLSLQIWNYVRKTFSSILHNKKIIYSVVTVFVILVLAVTGSKITIFARTKESINFFINYKKEETESKEEDKAEDTKEKTDAEMTDDISGEDLYVYTEEEIIEQFGVDNYMEAKNILMTYEDKNLEEHLSDDDYVQIFFQSGKYKIGDWNNQEEIDEKVLQRIEDEVAQNNQNIFDGSASEDLKNEIDTVRKKAEEKITFAERIEITEFREKTYEQYPKSALALLTANDNQAYALALVLIGGKQQTQMYYYGQSVLWGLEYLSYEDVSDYAIRQRINWIAKRYEDIRFICSTEDAEYMYADRLMTAYRHAAAAF